MSTIPDGWSVRRLASLVDYRAGRTPARAEPEFWAVDGHGTPWVSIADMKPFGTVRSTKEQISRSALESVFGGQVVPAGTLLMSYKLTIGRVATLGVPACHNEAIIAISPRSEIEQGYLGYYLSQVDYDALQDRQIMGYTLNREKLDRIEILVPPVQEQRAIGMILDVVVRAAELHARALSETERLKRATMQALFTRGLRGAPQKDTEIGRLPENWDVVSFDEAFEIAQGQVDPKVEPYASMPHIGPENVEAGSGRLLQCASARELGLVSGKYLFTRSDIVYSKIRPYLSKVALPDFDGLCSADMYPLRTVGGYSRAFLFQFLLSEVFLRQAVPQQARTGIPKLNREQLASVRIPRPTLVEQQEIAVLLSALDRKIVVHHRKRAVLDELFKALLHKLMTGEIRVTDLNLDALAAKTSSPRASA